MSWYDSAISNGFHSMNKDKFPFRKTMLAGAAAVGILTGTPSGKFEMDGYEFSFGTLSADAQTAGKEKVTESNQYKEQIKAFYQHILEKGESGKMFRRIMKQEGHVQRPGQPKTLDVTAEKLKKVFRDAPRAFPLVEARNFKMLTININKQSDGNLLITMILQDAQGKTNTNTVLARPEQVLKGKEEDEE